MAINLLPWRERQDQRRLCHYGLLLLLSMGAITTLMIGVHYFLNTVKNNYQSHNLQLARQIADKNTPINNLQLTADYQTLTEQIQLIQRIHWTQNNFWREINLLQAQLPENMQLTQIIWNPQEICLHGIATHTGQIGLLLKYLGKSRLFSQAILEDIEQKEQGALYFTMRAVQPLAAAS